MFRDCGECTKCCEGYLHGETDLTMKNGRVFKLGGSPCPIVELGKGCTDYENRPESPCRGFKCEWLKRPDVYPDEMRPDRILAIFSLQEVEGVPYLRVTEAGSKLDSEVLSHAIKVTLSNRFNLYWEVDGKMHWFGNKDFITVMNKYKEKSLK
jgi:hypothetical protein